MSSNIHAAMMKISTPLPFCGQNADKIQKSPKIKNALTVYYQQIKAFCKVPRAGVEPAWR